MSFIKDNRLVLWLINESFEACNDCELNVSNLDLKEGMTINEIYWDSTSVITGVENDIIANATDQFKTDILPRSINCFVINPHSTTNSLLLSNKTIELTETLTTIYPNPTTGLLNIETIASIASILVYDINGRQVKNMTFSDKTINMSALQNGMYFLTIQTANSLQHFNVIKN